MFNFLVYFDNIRNCIDSFYIVNKKPISIINTTDIKNNQNQIFIFLEKENIYSTLPQFNSNKHIVKK